MNPPDLLIALKPVIDVFAQLSISYYIGGSVASSLYGMSRATMDVDIIADIKKYHVQKLVTLLESKYYIDADMIFAAIQSSSSFNIIHLDTAYKIDIFIFKDEPHLQNALERKVKDSIDSEHDFECYFSTPEDIIIAKLIWFEQGGRISERQWKDILGVIKVQSHNLDFEYLKRWSEKLGIFDLLNHAMLESGIELSGQ